MFGSKPGAYGAGLQTLIDERIWQDEADLADAYLGWSGWAYGAGGEGRAERGLFEARLAATDAVLHNQDNREHDLLDSDDYYQFEGGLAVAVRHLSGRAAGGLPQRPFAARPAAHPHACARRSGRIVRGRAANPRWIAGVMRHGYKGAAEIAATVDYLFAFAATARAVDDAHFDALYDAYLGDAAVRDFMAAHNPAALAETEPPVPRGDRARPVAARAATASARRSSANAHERCRSSRRRDQPAPPREDGSGGRRRARKVLATKTEERGLADRPYRRRQGQIDRRVRHGAALPRPRHAGRHRAVRQGRLGHRRARPCWRGFPISSPAARWARGSPGTRRTAPATSPPPAPPGRWRKAMIADPSYRLVLLDELNIVLRYDYLPLDEVIAVLHGKPRDLHVVVTGRNAPPELIETADLVTEMTLVKHPFRAGVKAQPGIEF